jgi:hypothetical protein
MIDIDEEMKKFEQGFAYRPPNTSEKPIALPAKLGVKFAQLVCVQCLECYEYIDINNGEKTLYSFDPNNPVRAICDKCAQQIIYKHFEQKRKKRERERKREETEKKRNETV